MIATKLTDDPVAEQAFAVHQMRETSRYIDEHAKAPDDLAEFLRHWAVVTTTALAALAAERDNARQQLADIEGDNDKLADGFRLVVKQLADAPHDSECWGWINTADKVRMDLSHCDCWKAGL